MASTVSGKNTTCSGVLLHANNTLFFKASSLMVRGNDGSDRVYFSGSTSVDLINIAKSKRRISSLLKTSFKLSAPWA